jgi:hypothetical protein
MRRGISLLALVLLAAPVDAATYYVDFSGGSDSNNGTSTATPWKRVKGMAGVTSTAASATINAADTIIFKGGVTWTSFSPWNVWGATYTVDQAWYTGGSWSRPIFDNQSASTVYSSNPVVSNALGTDNIGTRAITFDNLRFTQCGQTLVAHDGACFYFNDVGSFTFTNNTMDGYCGRTCMMLFYDTSKSNLTFTGNDVSHTATFVWIATTASGAVVSNITMNNNVLHDFASQLGNTGVLEGNHGDGFLHYFSVPTNDSTQYLDTFTFCDNRTYGDFSRGIGTGNGEDMSGFFYVEGAIKNALICNNDFTMLPMQNSASPLAVWGDGFISLRASGNSNTGNVWIFNNSFGFSTSSGANGAILYTDGGWSGIHFKNNIISAQEACISTLSTTPTGSSDYNEYRCAAQGFVGTWITDGGHSIYGAGGSGAPNSNPLFNTDFTNLRLTSSSPGKGTGVNLSSVSGLTAGQQTTLNSDRDGIARPSGSTAWDMGAYQFDTSGGSVGGTNPSGSPRMTPMIQLRRGN